MEKGTLNDRRVMCATNAHTHNEYNNVTSATSSSSLTFLLFEHLQLCMLLIFIEMSSNKAK